MATFYMAGVHYSSYSVTLFSSLFSKLGRDVPTMADEVRGTLPHR